MCGGYEQIPESFIRDLECKRRRLVKAQVENDVNLDALVDFLYPDTAHLVFELLQNAEDAEATSARFELSDTKLSFTHDGRPFSKKDLDDITNYFKSAKYEQEDKIGRFGIGFKSVFGCTETPRIYSDTVAFEIVDRIVPRSIPRPACSIRLTNRQTVIELPFNGKMKTADEARKEIRLGLEQMSVMSVLHLECIKAIKWRTDAGESGSLIRTDFGNGVVQIRAIRPTGEEKRCFLRFREPYADDSLMHLDVVFELEEREREKEALQVEDEVLADRFRIVPAERGSVAVFFPATKETSNLRFHLHAPFIPELSRASIKEHRDNNALIGRLAELVARSLPPIRDLGLLDREFLGVLPNSQDRLPEAYKPCHQAVVQAMREEPLVPMQGGGHGSATRLMQGRGDFKDFLGVDDIRFLLSGWDGSYSWDRTRRSNLPSSNYRGWAVSATQRNSAVDRLLSDLTIREFKDEHLAPPMSKTDKEIEEWLGIHDVAWHRAYYASVGRVRAAGPGAYERLKRRPIVRSRSGEYRPAAECHFASDEEVPEGITIADPDIYSSGRGAKRAKIGLEGLGVCEIDDESRAIGILDKYYSESGHRPTWDEHRNHMETFIGLIREGRVTTVDMFGKYKLFLDHNENWLPPGRLYAGKEYPDASAAPYFRNLERLADDSQPAAQALRYELHRRYRYIPGFSKFARRIGVCYRIPITKTGCHKNPDWLHLESGGGVIFTDYGTDRDWHIPCLDRILQLETAETLKAERVDMARAIWTALSEAIEGSLKASFRRNYHAYTCYAPSQLVFTLREYAWVPQKQGRDDLVFVTPRKARPDQLPEGFAFDSGWAWIKATEFGEERREVERKAAQERLDQEEDARELEAKAKELGFVSLDAVEDAKWLAELPESERRELREWHESRHHPRREFDKPKNPARRRVMAVAEAREARSRKTVGKKRALVEGEAKLKEEARTKLRANYEEHAHVSLCQVIGCQDRSFKLKEGAWYFEAVRFLGLDKMVAADYLALCPRHAAMFQHTNESKNGLKGEFVARSASGNGLDALEIPAVLAGEDVEVLLAPKHVLDLGAALEVDGEKVSGASDSRTRKQS